jgi:hypothetical protein
VTLQEKNQMMSPLKLFIFLLHSHDEPPGQSPYQPYLLALSKSLNRPHPSILHCPLLTVFQLPEQPSFSWPSPALATCTVTSSQDGTTAAVNMTAAPATQTLMLKLQGAPLEKQKGQW